MRPNRAMSKSKGCLL